MARRGGSTVLYVLAYVVFIGIVLYSVRNAATSPAPKAVAYSELLNEIRAGHVQKVLIDQNTLKATLKPDAVKKGEAAELSTERLPGIDETALIKDLEEQNVAFTGHAEEAGWWAGLLSWVVPILFFAAIWGFGMRRMTGGGAAGPMTFGKSRAKIHDQSTEIKETFEDVAGVEEAKAELVEIVDFLKHPMKYQQLGGRIPKGVLLVGPPGTGKTLLARAVSGEAGVPFFSISGSEFIEMFVGVGAARVRDLFEQAKLKAPCIIFIDELDAIGKSRSAAGGGIFTNEEREQTLNQLLAEMDGFDSSKGVIIMAATNTPEVLDPALLRPGRFDRQVIVDRPDLAGREAILKVHARKIKLSPQADLKVIAARTPGMVGADLANIVNEAALLGVRRGSSQVEMRDLEEAIDRVMLGLEKKNRVMTASEKERVAYHETGHALVALSLKHADPVYRVSIIPRSIGALGHTLQLPTEEKYLMTVPQLQDQITVMLGGRAAEELVYNGIISTGAADDLQRASESIRQMVTRFGMSDRLGNLTYGIQQNTRFLHSTFTTQERNYSEKTSEAIDTEVRRIGDELYTRAKSVLSGRRAELERIAKELVEKETLDQQQLDRLLDVQLPKPA
ncbi:MAG TPA: ATP-dependent zinc metalloprotease FtsH [Terriglobia bacterium]|jgi:cell division protease FtsH